MTDRAQSSLHARLMLDHDQLDAFLDRLIAAFRSGDRGEAADAYEELEWRLREHFAYEEKTLFDEFARVDPEETAALRREHADLVERIEALGVGVDLHETRLAAIEELARRLKHHAARENTVLYRWADHVFSDHQPPNFETQHPGA